MTRFPFPLVTFFLAFTIPISKARGVPDDIFLQEISEQINSTTPLLAVGIHDKQIFAGSTNGLSQLRGKELVPVPAFAGRRVSRLVPGLGTLWALTDRGVFAKQDQNWALVSTNLLTDVVEHQASMVGARGKELWRLNATSAERLGTNQAPFDIARLASYSESIYLLGQGRLTMFDGQSFGGKDLYDFPADLAWDWGDLPSRETRDLAAMGSRLLIATPRGLGVLRGMSLTTLRGEHGLPFEDLTCLAPGFANDLWIGTTRGAIRQTGSDFHYFAGKRWLPDDRVHAIASSSNLVAIATASGLGIIRYEPFTLHKKARFYEQHLEDWGQKRLGFLHKLEWDDNLREFVREVSDNDGGYSGDYLAAQSYRFAVTRDPAARAEALNTFHALRWLEHLTGIPGFPARSAWVKNEKGHKASGGSGGYPAEWHDSADQRFEWKGDTSSDEICSHFYAISVFLEHAAQGEEIAQAKRHLARIARHLIDHRWQLIDLDGKPTRWGRWDPDYFLTEEGRFDRGLQALEILSFIKTAETLAPEPKFTRAYEQLVSLGYPAYTLRQRSHFPPDSVLHFEDQLAFWSYWNLLKFERNPVLRSMYRRSFERTYEVLRIEQQPWFNFVYGVLTTNTFELHQSVNHLREWPLDLRIWSYQNSHRADLRTPSGYAALKAGIRPFSPREREPMRWDAWTMQADGGTGGRDVVEPSGWLVTYWMGRYYGYIQAPSGEPPGEFPETRGRGAKPYEGPPRPTNF